LVVANHPLIGIESEANGVTVERIALFSNTRYEADFSTSTKNYPQQALAHQKTL